MLGFDLSLLWLPLLATAIVLVPALLVRSDEGRFWVLSLVPTAWLMLFYGFVLRARLALGYWPRPYQPDPKDLSFDLHYGAVFVGIYVVIVSAAAWLVFVLVRNRQSLRKTRHYLGMAYFVATFIAWWFILRVDPGSFFTWLLD